MPYCRLKIATTFFKIFCVLLFLFHSTSFACEVHFIGNNFSVLESSEEIPVSEVLKKTGDFKKAFNENLGFSKDDKWVLIDLSQFEICDEEIVFELTYPHLNQIQCYLINEHEFVALDDIAAIGRRHDNRFAFKANIDTLASPELLVYLKSGFYPISFYSFIWSYNEYVRNIGRSHRIIGLFFGAYAMLIFFLFIGLVYNRTTVLFYFFIYNFLFAVYLFLDMGVYWLVAPVLTVNVVSLLLGIIPPLASIAGFLFLERFYFLNLKKSVGFFVIVFALFVLAVFILSLNIFKLGLNFQILYSYILFFVTILCVVLVISFVTLQLIIKPTPRNAFLFIGIFFHMLGVLFLISNSLDVLPTIHIKPMLNFNVRYHINWYIPSLIYVGVILEIVVFLLMLFQGIREKIEEDTIAITNYNRAKQDSLKSLLQGELRVRSQINEALNVDVIRPLLDVDAKFSDDIKNRYLRKEIHEIINEINLIVSNLYQEQHSNESVRHWIESFLLQIQNLTDIDVSWEIDDLEIDDLVVRDTIYKVLQETVNNSIKHATAKRMSITLRKNSNDLILLKISDDGKGLDMNNLKPGIGMMSMYHRVKNINGEINFYSKDQKGLEVYIKIPSNG